MLAIGPHPDDVDLSCGGWLAAASGRGQRVVVVDLTRGERATNGTPEGRAAEAAAAAEILGAEREQLGLPDCGLRADDPEQTEALVAVIRRHRPRLVLAPWVEARHPDHAAAGRLAERAVFLAGVGRFQAGAPHRPLRLIHYLQRREVRPSFVVDVSASHAQKVAAIGCYASQFGAGEATLINGPLGVDAFFVRDRYWGAAIGVSHGEPYLVGGPLPVADPVAHFQAHPNPPVLIP